MTKICKGCGAVIQTTDPKGLGYSPKEDADYCQRCFRMRHYGDVTINMQKGIESSGTLKKIADLDATVFWIVDAFNIEENLIDNLNEKLPGKDIIMILSKRDLLPATLTDQKLAAFVEERLKEHNTQVQDIFSIGFLNDNNIESQEAITGLRYFLEEKAKKNNIVFMGVANAGKSTLINRLLNTDALTISRNPGTTLDLIKLEGEDGHAIYDTPGLENHDSILTLANTKDLKKIIPMFDVKPRIFQIYQNQSFAVGGLARLDVWTDKPASVVAYFAETLEVHRGKLENADELWKKHLGKDLSPALDKSMKTMTTYSHGKIRKGDKIDVVIYGLGWFSLVGPIQKVEVKVHDGVKVVFRKAML